MHTMKSVKGNRLRDSLISRASRSNLQLSGSSDHPTHVGSLPTSLLSPVQPPTIITSPLASFTRSHDNQSTAAASVTGATQVPNSNTNPSQVQFQLGDDDLDLELEQNRLTLSDTHGQPPHTYGTIPTPADQPPSTTFNITPPHSVRTGVGDGSTSDSGNDCNVYQTATFPSPPPQPRRIDSNHGLSSVQIRSMDESILSADKDLCPGSLHRLSQLYESLDYEVCENALFIDETRTQASGWRKFIKTCSPRKSVARWIIILLIAIFTALTACAIVVCVEILSYYKFTTLKGLVDRCVGDQDDSLVCYLGPLGFWLISNCFPVALGSLLVTYVAPVAAGSGIPAIKCYLNGVKVPEVVRVKTFIAKFFGVITSVVGGLAVGKEGPMIHCGAVIAAGISQGKTTTFKKDLGILESFRDDREKRDFVSAGAAAGVAAAFGAPVGGVLFSLEEGASFWNQALTWRIFFCSMMSVFTLNFVMSIYHGVPGQLNSSGLLNFGKFSDISYSLFEIPIYIVIGVVGGLLGAIFCFVNYRITVLRMRYLDAKWIKVLEAVIVSFCTACVGFAMIMSVDDCHERGNHTTKYVIQFHCPDGHYSAMSELWFNTPEATVVSLFHADKNAWAASTLAIFASVYFFLAIWTYGLSVSSGLFVPSLLTGAAIGRLIGIFAEYLLPGADWICPGKFALIGAAAVLGGVVRMTLSLTVILIEGTGNLSFGLPIMITLVIAKWVGDYFIDGLYDLHIHLAAVPFLNWEPPIMHESRVYASDIMSYPVVTFNPVEKVGRIIDVLTNSTHNGFPVVDPCLMPSGQSCAVTDSAVRKRKQSIRSAASRSGAAATSPGGGDELDDDCGSEYYCQLDENGDRRTFGRLRGIVLRWQLIVMLKHKLFNETAEGMLDILNQSTFRNAYPRYPSIEEVARSISPAERNYSIDLRPLMNPSPYAVSHPSSLSRVFRLFRALGLRHLVVINDRNEVIGIVTRKDLARYKNEFVGGRMALRELRIFR